MGALEFVVNEGPSKGKVFAFPGRSFVIGSSADCQLRFEPSAVRSRHAAVSTDTSGVVWVRDLSGAKLLWLNGQVVEEGQLAPGTFLRLGRVELVVRESGTGANPSFSRRPTEDAMRGPLPEPDFGLEPKKAPRSCTPSQVRSSRESLFREVCSAATALSYRPVRA